MCHSCVSRNPGFFMPAPVLCCSKRGQGNMDSSFLDSRLRGNDTPDSALLRSAGLSRQGKGELLQSPNLTVSTGNYDHNLWCSIGFLTHLW